MILRHAKDLRYLPLSFHEGIHAVLRGLDTYNTLYVIVTQEFKGTEFRKDRGINRQNLHDLFAAQIELSLDILKHLNKHVDVYERYEVLQGIIFEYNLLKSLVNDPSLGISYRHIDFMGNEFIPLINNHLERIDEELKIKNHRSFVRKKLVEQGIVEFSTGIDEVVITNILAFLEANCATKNDFLGLKDELCHNTTSHPEFYNLKTDIADTIIVFFKIMQDRQVLSKITNKDLSKWLYRKLRYFKNGEYQIAHSERTILDKVNVKLTAKEKIKELNINFRK
jgi:hypothetical protein